MAQEPTRNDKAESDSEDPRRECSPNSATSDSSGVGETEFDRWLRSKAEKKLIKLRPLLGKRTGFNRSPLKKTPLKKTSNKQKDRLKEYKNATELHFMLEHNKKCFLCGNDDNLSIHHIEKRGKNIARNLVTLCMNSTYMNNKFPDANPASGCHQFIERNHNLARELGLLK